MVNKARTFLLYMHVHNYEYMLPEFSHIFPAFLHRELQRLKVEVLLIFRHVRRSTTLLSGV